MSFVLWGLGILISFTGLIVLSYLYLSGHFRRQKHYDLVGLSASNPHFLVTAASMSDSLITQGEATQFWANIAEIQSKRLALMAQAKEQIQFETFIMMPGKRSHDFAEILKRKASEGVLVQLLADSYGAGSLPQQYWTALKNAGVEVRFFNPFSGRAPLDYLRRNHRKLLIVDQKVAMIGGAGMADRWDGEGQYEGGTPWYDFEVEWQGEAVGLLSGFFWQHWLDAGGHVDLGTHSPNHSVDHNSTSILITPGEDPTAGNSSIRSLFQLCIAAARKRLWIASPYLLPDDATCEMFKSMRQKGVDIRILTMGPKSDKPYVYYVSRERYPALLENDIEIYEYQPSMMHAKVILVDNDWVSLGSANLDPRSFFHNDELNLCTTMSYLIDKIETFFETGFSQSQRIRLKSWKQRPLKERVVGKLGNFFYWQL
ncbi:phosphatidylserine/phosphatidylglycerophosphate/cardiolipin synthase family protein [Oscillatoria sp. CS-180]|uniref:phospholipase D-like domain-containing protein n=1 Tax=Oscillatoria sp. CS-180 TaxID=3021720 RepID=UPI00232C9146|nr:phosphatidylserine/phosphatidylglycerophosphate/cardiolipin synthase family protein [Oscillatoria sp. CS-180]MDB9524722.1 phosphatidylserine/phosphatidylglycerophosphate/cardiolipin synthase family protein [Oscillatoria sp. CS-180]